MFVLLGLLLHLLPLLNVVDEREEVAQVNDERLRLGERSGKRSYRGLIKDVEEEGKKKKTKKIFRNKREILANQKMKEKKR